MKDWRTAKQSRFSDRFEEFLREFRKYEKQYLIRKAQDEFLDAYSRWLKTRNLNDKLDAIRKAMKLEALDSSFSLRRVFPPK